MLRDNPFQEKVIKIKESALLEAIRLGLGSQGIWTPEIEEIIMLEIKREAVINSK